MRLFGRFLVVAAATVGGLLASQLPEFAQQYRQRLGGALEELRAVVAAFDADAGRNDLTRPQALAVYGRSDQPFLRDQAASVGGTIDRYEHLVEQRARLEAAPPLMRPVVTLSAPDRRVLRGTWGDFEPAVPVTPAGFVWAAVGFFALGGLVSLVRQAVGIGRRRHAASGARGTAA